MRNSGPGSRDTPKKTRIRMDDAESSGTGCDGRSSPNLCEVLGHVDKWRIHRRIEVMSMKPRKLWAVLS